MIPKDFLQEKKDKVKKAYHEYFVSDDYKYDSFLAKLDYFIEDLPLVGIIYEPFSIFFHRYIMDIPKKMRWSLQRLWRGHADADLWNLDWFIIRKIRKPLKEFIKNKKEYGLGIPAQLVVGDNLETIRTDEEGEAEWHRILDAIERAFDLMHKEYTEVYFPSREEQEEIQEGLRLFGEWFRALWD